MIVLVDSSVLIDHIKVQHNPKADIFDEVIERGIPFGISVFTYQEVLQGARDEREYRRLVKYLGSMDVRYPPEGLGVYASAARLYFDLRRQGITIRNAIDTLIAVTAIENDLFLLHNDRDFDAIAAARPDLRILTELTLEQVPVMTEAISALREVSAAAEFRELERARFYARHNEASALGHARDKGRAEGRAEVARAALRKNMPLEIIADLTGLSPDEIRSLASF